MKELCLLHPYIFKGVCVLYCLKCQHGVCTHWPMGDYLAKQLNLERYILHTNIIEQTIFYWYKNLSFAGKKGWWDCLV